MAPASAPVSGRPEKPEPSTPVIMPTISRPKDTNSLLCGNQSCAPRTRSNSRLGVWLADMPRMAAAVSLLPRKKKPAIGSTEPMARKANTKPSVMWLALSSSMAFGPW
ncbi:hypothetical protein Y695_04100 [Hydrogenophaga sp. T4]|nr:hypothetical protein Y695_04100 [Hydrogenophaga sp. T4]